MTVSPNAKRGWRAILTLPIAGAFVFFFCLWLLDFPKPTYDDLFQAGAALNLAGHGDFSNPLIARQEFPSHYFFVYPPLNSYVFAGWLKLFGISAASATAFPILCCFIIAAATSVVLRRHGASVWLEWSVPLGVLFGILYLGLRPEPLAVALAMTGFALTDADATHQRAAFQFPGFLLLILGASAAPRVTLFVVALGIYAAYRAWQGAGTTRERCRVAGWGFGALFIASLLFLLMIDFRLGEFLHTFHYHAAGRLFKNKLAALTGYLVGYLGYLQISIVALPLALLIWVIKKPKDELSKPALFMAGAVPFVLWTGGIGSATAWWAFLIMVLLAGSLLKGLSRSGALALQVVIFLILGVINRKNFVQCWGTVAGDIQPDHNRQFETALTLQPTPEHPMLVDGWVARYVYGYRLPKGVIDAEWSVRFPGAGPGSYLVPNDTSPQLRKGDIFVIGNYMRHCLQVYTHLDPTNTDSWKAFGLRQLGFEAHPRWVYIIPSEDCKDVRISASVPLPSS